ncbi:MAG TPA: GyrI-like domain-containing protein [Candidatus Limnocylindrales bacterium]|nr:GyrI-like domain-containing protein [Candidatus Limnocylindrales bacterium]
MDLLHAASDRPLTVTVPARTLFAIDGLGAPIAADFRLASRTLRRVDEVLRSVAAGRGDPVRHGFLEVAWWQHPEPGLDELVEAFADRTTWHWQQMIEVPAGATKAEAEAAIAAVQREAGREQPLLRIIRLPGGPVAQMLHIGRSDTEPATLRALVDAVDAAELQPRGHVHEIRLVDEHEVPANRARSILRIPLLEVGEVR